MPCRLLLLLAAVLLSSCGGNPEKSAADAGGVDTLPETCADCLEQGTLYRRRGNLSDAIDLYLESRKLAQEKGDAPGEAAACNALAELYLYWDVPGYADIYISQALARNEEQHNGHPMIAVQSLLLKGQIVQETGHPDSALYYYDRAEKISSTLPYTAGQADVDYLTGAFRLEHCTGDSLAEGWRKLRRVTAEGTPLLRAKAYYRLALGDLKEGRQEAAEIMLDSMYSLMHRFNPPQYIEVDYEVVLRHYLAKKDLPNVERYVLDLIEECKFNFNSDICTKMYENIVTLQTEAEQQRLRLSQMEAENSRLYYRVCICISVLILTLAAVLIFYKRRLYRIKQQLLEARLSALLDHLQDERRKQAEAEARISELTLHKEKTEQKLTELLTEKENRKEAETVTPGLLQEEGEARFRQRFNLLYPRFHAALQEKAPNIGRREELLAMLIVLRQDMHQIEAIMGIAYRSVNMARYRLRKKLGLDGDESLEDTIRKLAEEA